MTSITSSRKRTADLDSTLERLPVDGQVAVAIAVTVAIAIMAIAVVTVAIWPGSMAKHARLSEPRLQASLGRSGCSPQGLVASIWPKLGRGIGRAMVDTVDEDQSGVAGAPRRLDDALEYIFGPQPGSDLASVWRYQIILTVAA